MELPSRPLTQSPFHYTPRSSSSYPILPILVQTVMHPRDDLHQLLSTLDKNERRYLNLYTQSPHLKNGPKYLRLLQALYQQPTYDEAALKATLHDQPWIKYLSTEKHNLYQFVLQAMQSYQEPTPNAQIQNALTHARFLRQKGLFAQAENLLAKALQLADHHDAYLDGLAIIEEQRSLLKEQATRNRETTLLAAWQRTWATLDTLQQEWQLREILDKLFHLGRQEFLLRGPALHEQVQHWVSHPLLQPHAPLRSFKAHAHRHNILAIYHQLQGAYHTAHEYFTAGKSHWEAHPTQIERNPTAYLLTISNYLHGCALIGDYQAIPPTLDRIRALKTRTWNETAEVFQNTYYYQLLYLLNQYQFEAAKELIPHIEDGLARYATKINAARTLAFQYNIAIAAFVSADFRLAKHWLQRINDAPESENRQDIRQAARIFVLICHYELGHDDLLESIYRSAYRHLQRRERLMSTEKCILDHLRDLIYTPQDQTSILTTFDQELRAILQAEPKTPPGALEISYWIQSKLHHQPMTRIAQTPHP